MKNVTIVLDEQVARWAKVRAAQHDTSVSRMLGEVLREMMEEENTYEADQKRFLRKEPVVLKSKEASYPDRDSLYDR